MKIAFDGQLFLKGNKTGVAWNAHNIILELVKNREFQCVIQCFGLGYNNEQRKALDIYEKAGCKIEYCNWFNDAWYKLIWNFIPIPYRWFFKTKPDITQFFNFVVPPGVAGKRITIIHDMAYKACPETVRKKTKKWLDLSMDNTCKNLDHVITVSEFSKTEIIKYLGIAKEKISVVPNAVDTTIYNSNYSIECISEIKNKYHISGDYFLYLGTIEPRKNIERLIDAYLMLKGVSENTPKLIIAGGKGWMTEAIYSKAKEDTDIIFTGYVDQNDSPILMNGAKAFLFPSLYEGFGMPPLEAMACGTPVVASNTTSLPEVVKTSGLLVNPENVEEINKAMRYIIEDEKHDKYAKLGSERSLDFAWEKSARKIADIYKKLYSSQ